MNHQFPGSRSPVQGTINPFYHPQKDIPNPNNPTLYQNSQGQMANFGQNPTSKSYIGRSNIIEAGKSANNTSASFKNMNEGPIQQNKFGNGNVTSPTTAYSNTNYAGFGSNFSNKMNSEMVKSLIHDNPKPVEQNTGYPTQQLEKPVFLTNTPNRRAPRMSEPLQFDNGPPPKPF